jgi:hypothetical protein
MMNCSRFLKDKRADKMRLVKSLLRNHQIQKAILSLTQSQSMVKKKMILINQVLYNWMRRMNQQEKTVVACNS